MLSTFRDCQARELIIKLDNFGFAQMQKPSAPGEAASMLTAIPTPEFLLQQHDSILAMLWSLFAHLMFL